MLKKLLMVGLGLVLTLMTLTLLVVLGTVTHADAVRYSNSSWIDATKVTDPLRGQLYAITGDGVIEAQLCPLTKDDFNISTDALSGRIFVNHLGEAVPAVIWIAQAWFQVEDNAEDVLGLDRPRRLPELRAGSFWTSIKLGVGLVDQQPAPTVLVDAAG